jgi:hypothetical protein
VALAYKRKLLILSSLTAVLALLYVLSLVFDPGRRGRRSDLYSWLDPRLRDSVDGISIQGPGGELRLLRRNGIWLALSDGGEYPAREGRIADLLDSLTRRDSYPRRSSSPSSHPRFGLDEARAPRIRVLGGPGLPLLELLAGNSGGAGGEIFLRKAGSSEVRSGPDRFSSYLAGDAKSWYDLRLFPESGDGIAADSVQRLRVLPPAGEAESAGEGAPGTALEISRVRNGWRIRAGDLSLEPEEVEKTRVDSYITGIINTTGEDFAASGPFPESASLSLELEDGRVLTLRLGPPGGDSGRRTAAPGGQYLYVLAPWAVERLFREPEYFRRSGGSAR